jgi:hypothetical protein
MKRTIVILLLSGSVLGAGCSRPTAEAPPGATPTSPQKSERELAKEQKAKAKIVEQQPISVQPMADQPITAASPSPSASP